MRIDVVYIHLINIHLRDSFNYIISLPGLIVLFTLNTYCCKILQTSLFFFFFLFSIIYFLLNFFPFSNLVSYNNHIVVVVAALLYYSIHGLWWFNREPIHSMTIMYKNHIKIRKQRNKKWKKNVRDGSFVGQPIPTRTLDSSNWLNYWPHTQRLRSLLRLCSFDKCLHAYALTVSCIEYDRMLCVSERECWIKMFPVFSCFTLPVLSVALYYMRCTRRDNMLHVWWRHKWTGEGHDPIKVGSSVLFLGDRT